MGILFVLPSVLLAGVFLALAVMSFFGIRQRLPIALACYAGLVALALAAGLGAHDEFGFSIVPALILTAPWYFLTGPAGDLWMELTAGFLLNCVILWMLSSLIGVAMNAGAAARTKGDVLKP